MPRKEKNGEEIKRNEKKQKEINATLFCKDSLEAAQPRICGACRPSRTCMPHPSRHDPPGRSPRAPENLPAMPGEAFSHRPSPQVSFRKQRK
jgi:hypothetical protein